MERQKVSLADCSFEILTDGGQFIGLGAVHVGDVPVRSGRLPLRPYTESYDGRALAGLRLLGIDAKPNELRLKLEASFRRLPAKVMRDHSFDPIYDTADWDAPASAGTGRMDIVIRTAAESFEGVEFAGFSYHYDYSSADVPLYWIMDYASWELGGDITGATAFSQSSCSDPVAKFAKDTAWTTEGIIHWLDSHSKVNPVMTHNLPRWASHQAFDFQFKRSATLIGVFERVELIRSLLRREAGKPELKTFDKHIFDQALHFATSPKKILLNSDPKTPTDQQNLWTWIFDAVANRARAEFGLKEEPVRQRLGMNYWFNFTYETYYKDLLPCAEAIGIKALFIDPCNKNSMTEQAPNKDWSWNMCCGHEYEPAPRLGGYPKLKELVERSGKLGIMPFSWTNNDQSYGSPICHGVATPGVLEEFDRKDFRNWFVKMEDARLRYGGAYTNAFVILNFAKKNPRSYWVKCLKKIRQETGLAGYLFDSFYNLGFMPVDYSDCTPTTMWRGTLQGFKELQDADVHFLIESFGPFGEVQHGCPASYSIDNIFACYKIGLGTGYTTIPTGQEKPQAAWWPVPQYYKILAHMANVGHTLFLAGKRLDEWFTESHKKALADYNANREFMHKRILQGSGKSVLWHDQAGTRATLWNLKAQQAALPGKVRDLTAGKDLPKSAKYRLLPCHTYSITAKKLPVKIG
ncbi:MAG TPA: hypothetical protein VM186_15355 [Planctomycetota bacterium]|nr:hypothetical protein [Planctomycetota bacterium]